MPHRERLKRGLSDRPITGAATEVAAKLIIQLIGFTDVAAIITLEKRQDESRRAVTALGAVAFYHLLLDRVELALLNGPCLG